MYWVSPVWFCTSQVAIAPLEEILEIVNGFLKFNPVWTTFGSCNVWKVKLLLAELPSESIASMAIEYLVEGCKPEKTYGELKLSILSSLIVRVSVNSLNKSSTSQETVADS